ncbi:hypothetical protein TNCV_4263981 [Trichonephila clavipes]|nr:hypothetical protein TNCV_4263981 [Trichonephila clavipes]
MTDKTQKKCKGQLALRDGSGVLYVASEAKHELKLPPSGMKVPVTQSVNRLALPYGSREPSTYELAMSSNPVLRHFFSR